MGPAGQCSATVTKTWIEPLPQASNLTLTPAEASNDVGDEHTLTATVTDEDGRPIEGAPVTWTTSGVGDIEESETTTDSNGVATAVISSDEAGDQLVTASTSPCAQGGDCSDTAVKHWTSGPCTITGGGGRDVAVGGSGRDTVAGSGGNDSVRGSGGADVVRGNRGKDRLNGGGGNDRLGGGAGSDVVKGGSGRDRLDGGPGSDRCDVGPGGRTERRCER